MADAADSKSAALKACGFKSRLRHHFFTRISGTFFISSANLYNAVFTATPFERSSGSVVYKTQHSVTEQQTKESKNVFPDPTGSSCAGNHP